MKTTSFSTRTFAFLVLMTGAFVSLAQQWDGRTNTSTVIYRALTAYSNPFSDAITVEHYQPYSQPVELILYNNQRRKAKTLINKILEEEGFHKISIDANEHANGSYFYVFKADEEMDLTETLLLIK
jgi:hypothetical protein